MTKLNSIPAGDDAWQREIASRATRRMEKFEIDRLPRHLRRNSIDYYYLSVWPGLLKLSDASSICLPDRPSKTHYAYIHFPFCSGLCDFCSYFLKVSHRPEIDTRISRYLDDLVVQMSLHQRDTELDLSCVYFGGGTPSLILPERLAQLLDQFRGLGAFSDDLIGTMEIHPELFNDERRADSMLDVLAEHSIRRVSLGLQTGDTGLLSRSNRRHGTGFLLPTVQKLRDRGFMINIDIMYGIPDQSLEAWLRCLELVIMLSPDSISTYFTFVDQGTKLLQDVKQGCRTLADHSQVQIQHIAAQLSLEDAGYFELPNDFYSRPSVDPKTFTQQSLPSEANSLALGAGAYGYYSGMQYYNQFNLRRYSEMIRNRQIPLWRAAVLTHEEQLCRDIMFSLKNAPALDMRLFMARYNASPLDVYADVFHQLSELNVVAIDDWSIRLTDKGRLIVEEVACMFEPPDTIDLSGESAGMVRLLRKHNYSPTYQSQR
jgi:oxygen-independent coproporphyrinogen-3 oxidase